MTARKPHVRLAWGGFVDGHLDTLNVDTGWGGFGNTLTHMPAIFRSRAAARHRYQDVRRLKIEELPSGKKRP